MRARTAGLVVATLVGLVPRAAGADHPELVLIEIEPATSTLAVGEVTRVEVRLTDLPPPGLAAFQFEIAFDPNVVNLFDPNAAAADPFAPLGDDPAFCAFVRGTTCDDPAWLLTSTGREALLADATIDNLNGRMTLAYDSFGAPPPPTKDGVIGLIDVLAVGGGETLLRLENVILFDASEPPSEFDLETADATVEVDAVDCADDRECPDDQFCRTEPGKCRTEHDHCRNERGSCKHDHGSCGSDGSCALRPESCADRIDPVCGCDGTSYENQCSAAQAGVSIDFFGTCPPTPTPTATATVSPTPTPTASASPTATGTATASPSGTATPTATAPPTPSPSVSPTSTPTGTASPSVTATASPMPTASASPTATATASPTVSPSLEVSIRAQRINMKDQASRPSQRKPRFKFRSVTREAPDQNRIALPEPGSPGDPTQAGAELRVYNSAGLASDDVKVSLPASGWKRLGKAGDRGYRFRGAGDAPIDVVVVRKDRLVIRSRGDSFTYTLDEPAQGRIAVRLELGSGVAFCAEAAEPKHDRVNRFFAARNAPPPSCP